MPAAEYASQASLQAGTASRIAGILFNPDSGQRLISALLAKLGDD